MKPETTSRSSSGRIETACCPGLDSKPTGAHIHRKQSGDIRLAPAWSGFAVVGNVCLTQEQREGSECVVACDLRSGNPLWSHADPARYHTTIAGEGPRATPTVSSNRVFTFGGTGLLNCLDLATGKRLWSHDVVAESGAKVLQWGCASSPLIVNDLVVVHGGEDVNRSLFAYRIQDGKPAWVGGNF